MPANRYVVALLALTMATAADAIAQLEVRNSLIDWNPTATQQPVSGWYFYAYRAHDPREPASYRPMEHFGTGWRCVEDPLCSIYSTTQGILQSPSSEWEPVRAYVAWAPGTIRITPAERIGRPIGYVEGDGVRLQAWRNGWRALDVEIPANEVVNVDFTTEFAVNTDDVVYFHCTRNRAPFRDSMVFQPQLALYPGPGYDPTVQTSDSGAAFPGNARWRPEGFRVASQTYEAMVPGVASPHNLGSYVEVPNSGCRVYQDLVHTVMPLEAVWTYTAPADGQLLLRDVGGIAKRFTDHNLVDLVVYHRPAGTGERIEVREVPAIDKAGRKLGKSLHVRANDEVSVHFRNAGQANWDLFTRCSLRAELHPRGAPRSQTTIASPLVVVAGERRHHFHEVVKVQGDLTVAPGGSLTVDDCVVMLDNVNEMDFRYYLDGEFTSRDSVIGGNRQAPADTRILHSNVVVRGDWTSIDSEVRYTYGQLLRDNATMTAKGHVSVAHGDFVNLGDSVNVTLDDCVIALAFSVDTHLLTGDAELDLQVDTFSTQMPAVPTGGQGWTGSMTDTMVYQWLVKARGLTGAAAGQVSPYEVRIRETVPGRVGMRLSNVAAGSGSVDLYDSVTGIPPGTTWTLFHSRWRAAGPGNTHLRSLDVDCSGSSDLRMVGFGESNEMMANGGSSLNLIGTPGTHDAHSNATRIQSTGAGSRMVLDNCSLGTPWTVGEIIAKSDSQIAIRDALVEHTVSIRAVDASSSKVIVSSWTGNGQLETSGRVFEVVEHYSFDDNDDEWRTWDLPPRGFVDRFIDWPAPGATLATNAQALRCLYPAKSAYGSTLNARLVAPAGAQPTILSVAGDLYLYARIRVQVANPRTVAGQPVVGLKFSTRDPAAGWSSWGNYIRTMDLVADGQYHEYCWKLTDPSNSPDPFTSYGLDPAGGTSLPAETDYWALHFNSSADIGRIDGAAGDFVEIDFLTLADHYDVRLRSW